MDVAKEHQLRLEDIKTNVSNTYAYFKHNYDRYNEFRRFVFETSLTNDEVTLLATINRPQLEFNVLEAYISRLLGEFSKQEPDILVSAEDDNVASPETIEIVQNHIRHELCDEKNHHVRYEVMKDLLSGGFSVMKLTTDYATSMSFKQKINIRRAFDPTMCGFDQLARESHKGDGQFCYELFPLSKKEFHSRYPDVALDELSYSRNFEGFNWSYLNDRESIIVVCDYYDKKIKRTKIVELRDGRVMTFKKYKDMVDNWLDLMPPPAIVGKPRMTDLETIVRYRVIENKVLEYDETDFSFLPLVFVDGSSMLLKLPKNGNVRQYTRPYIYHARDAQRFKNYAGIAWANELESTVQHKFMVAKEALPKEQNLLSAYEDVQKASVLVYNAFDEQEPNKAIPNPIREVAKIPAPPEIMQAFSGSDSLIQNILGSYDASLGINNNQLSGIAIVEAASQSNSTAMPYIVGFLQGLQRVAQIYLDLFPKYYSTPRTIPVLDPEGKRDYIKINQPGAQSVFYDANALNVTVSAGASFQVQKSRTIMMVKEMMGMSPLFAQFIADKGLQFVLDNMEGKGIEQLKSLVKEWQAELQMEKQRQQQMQQMEMQNNPAIMKAQTDRMKIQMQSEENQMQAIHDMAKLKQDEMKVIADLQQSHNDNAVQMVKAETERFAKQVDLQLKHHDQTHRHGMDKAEFHHKVTQPLKHSEV